MNFLIKKLNSVKLRLKNINEIIIKLIKFFVKFVLIIIGVWVINLINLNVWICKLIKLVSVNVSFVVIVYIIYNIGVINMNMNLIGFVIFVKNIVNVVDKNIGLYFVCFFLLMLWNIVNVIFINVVVELIICLVLKWVGIILFNKLLYVFVFLFVNKLFKFVIYVSYNGFCFVIICLIFELVSIVYVLFSFV